MRGLHVFAAIAVAFIVMMAGSSAVTILGFLLDVGSDTFPFIGIVMAIIFWAVGIFFTNNGPVVVINEGRKTIVLPVRNVFVVVPMLLGIILGFVSTLLFWLGVWLSITCVVLNVWRHDWESKQAKADR